MRTHLLQHADHLVPELVVLQGSHQVLAPCQVQLPGALDLTWSQHERREAACVRGAMLAQDQVREGQGAVAATTQELGLCSKQYKQLKEVVQVVADS